jgi:AcrR family transcriptional regulator
MSTQQDSPRLGRPRRFDGDTERGLLMDAAIEVMTSGNYLEVSVGDVLAAAGVSTRSFYRHFESKEVLLIAVMRRDAEAVGELLDRAVSEAHDPAAAVQAWLDNYLNCFYEPKRARRTTLYASPAANSSPAVIAEHAALHQILARSLTKALRAGHRAGALHSPKPHDDAMTVLALVSVAVNQRGDVVMTRTRKAARDHVMRFAWPAIGLSAR